MKKAVATLLAIALMGFLLTRFVALLEPAVEREYLAACRGLRPSDPPKELALPGYDGLPMPAPDFLVQDHEGKMRRLSEFKGQVVFLNFWATWCPPCAEEVPSIEWLQRELGDREFRVLALASSHDWESILKEFPDGTPMTVLLDPPANDDEQVGAVAHAFGVPKLPETFIIDRDGFFRYYFVNKRDWSSDIAVTCMQSLIEEKPALPWLKSWLWTMSQISSGS